MKAVRVLPAPEKIAEIRELAEYGWTAKDIAAKVFPDDPGSHGFQAVRHVIADVDGHDYDPVVDMVAVERALRGDAEVWKSLTHYERREFMLQVHARREAERDENDEDRDAYWGDQWSRKRGWQYKSPHDVTPEWMTQLAEIVGLPRAGALVQEAKAYAEARVL